MRDSMLWTLFKASAGLALAVAVFAAYVYVHRRIVSAQIEQSRNSPPFSDDEIVIEYDHEVYIRIDPER